MVERCSIHTSLLTLALQGFSEQGRASEADFPNTAPGEWTESWQRSLSPITQTFNSFTLQNYPNY